MKTFKQFLEEKFRNYRDSYYGVNVKGRGYGKSNRSVYDDDYLEANPEKMEDEEGKAVGWKHKLVPKKKIVSSAADIIPRSDDVIHRGMSHDEYHHIMKTGQIASRGTGNIGDEQQGLTYFTKDPAAADTYSNAFAISSKKPTPDKPAYIVTIRRPDASRIRNVEGTAEHEVGVHGPISADDIVAVHRGRVIAYSPEQSELTSTGKKLRTVSASSQLHWERIK